MIKSYAHKGLKLYATEGKTSGIQPNHKKKLTLILSVLDGATELKDIGSMPALRLHPLKGDMDGKWSVDVSGNWRVVFEFTEGDVYVVDYKDYH